MLIGFLFTSFGETGRKEKTYAAMDVDFIECGDVYPGSGICVARGPER